MHVSFGRSGGFAGLMMTAAADTDTLSPNDAAHLRSLVEAADFFRLTPVMTGTTTRPDRFQYEITVADGGRSHTVTVSESNVPSALRPLLDWMQDAARQG
jgi:hypothetical protein